MSEKLNVDEEIKCPNCGNEWNFHLNYDYSQRHLPVIDVLCNECGEIFEIKENPEENVKPT